MIKIKERFGILIKKPTQFLLFLLVGLSPFYLEVCSLKLGGDKMNPSFPIKVAITADKKHLNVGDKISLTAVITNNSQLALWIYPRPWLYETSYLKIENQSGRHLDVFYTVELDVAQPTHADLVQLKSGQSLTYRFQARYQETKLSNRGANLTKGTFLVFRDSAIRIPLKGHYFASVDWVQKPGLFLLPDDFDKSSVWNGRVTSNKVDIYFE